MKHYAGQLLIALALIVPWTMGIVLAQGFWSTLFTVFPPYAWYLVVEKVLQLWEWV